MIKVNAKGPFNVVAVSIDGVIALEVIRTLEEMGYKTQIFLVDAAPKTVQNILANYADDVFKDDFDVNQLEIRLLSHLLKLEDNKKVYNFGKF